MGKSNQKIRKTHSTHTVFEKHTQLVARALVTVPKNKKTTTLTYFDNLKKKWQDQGVKDWCYTKSFMSMTISNLKATAISVENTKLLK